MAPAEQPEGVQNEAALLEYFCEITSITNAWIQGATKDDFISVTVQSSQRNLASNAQRKFLSSCCIPASYSGQQLLSTIPVELRDVLLLSISPSGKRMLVARSHEKATLLELWSSTRLLRELSVPASLHGPVCNDGWFATGATWSPDESRVAYVAEAPPSTQTPLWGHSSSKSDADAVDGSTDGGGGKGDGKDKKEEGSAAPRTWRGIGDHEEDWGEVNTGKRRPMVFVLDTKAWTVQPVRGLPENSTAGQPVWSPCGSVIVCVVWPHAAPNFPSQPQRLGIVFCYNRPCELWAAAVPGAPSRDSPSNSSAPLSPTEAVQVTKYDVIQSAFSPRFDGAGERLLFLSQHAACTSGVHAGTASVHSLPWSKSKAGITAAETAGKEAPTEVLPVVPQSDGQQFPGLYAGSLLPQPVVGNNLVVCTQWRDVNAIAAVDLGRSTHVRRLTPSDGASWVLLDCKAGWLAAARSSPEAPPRLHVARFDGSSPGSDPLQWTAVAAGECPPYADDVQAALADMAVDTLQLRAKEGSHGADIPFEAVVTRPASAREPLPAVLLPHGGPHTAYNRSFMLPTAFLPALGYAVIAPNYRGSTGYGEDSVQSLPGHVGSADVADCMTALQAAVDKGWVDPKRVAVVGGSHGGFLTGHLIGQHPDAFAAAVMRNPVVDMSVMVHVTDIPDWCYIEGWGCEEGRRRMASRPSGDDLEHLRSTSPIAHVDHVKAPILFLLGAKDRRVPMTDPHLYIRALRARGTEAPNLRTIVFPDDTHALDRPQTEFEQWINVAAWLKTYLLKSS